MKREGTIFDWDRFEWLPGPLFAVDSKSVIWKANSYAVSFLACSGVHELVGKRLVDFYRYPEDWNSLLKRLKKERRITDFEVMYRSCNGEQVVSIESIRVFRMGEDGKHGIIIIGRDITRRLHIENKLMNTNMELLQLNTKLQNMQKQLVQEKSMSSLGTMAAGIAHEMNNPLGVVKSNQNTLRDYTSDLFAYISDLENLPGLKDSSEKKLLREKYEIQDIVDDIPQIHGEIERGIDRALDIVKSLDIFSAPVSSARSEVSPVEALKKALILSRAEYGDRIQFKLELNPVPKVPVAIHELVQSFLNLLINAFEATLKGNSKKKNVVTIRTRVDENWVYCDFENYGPPIEEEHLPRLFDPFFTTKEVGEGPGLGLTSVYQTIVIKYKGHIDVHSDAGSTVFTVRLGKA